jgi:erythromycin esterase
VNGYIHGTHDDVKEAVSEIGLWPWASTEMVDIVNWMRAYNTQNEDRELSFVGVDAQQFAATLTQIDLVLEKYGLHVTDTLVYAPLSYAEFILLKKKKDLAPYLNLVVQKEEVNTQSFTEEDRHHYATLIRHFRQIIEIQNAGKLDKQSRLRDNYMAMNMLSYINSDTTAKGIFWAHNGHIFNLSLNEFGSKRWSGTAGGYLKETIGGEYFSLGFEFDEGSFNAYVPDSNSDIKIEKKKYTLGEVTVGPSAGGTLAATYRELKSPLFIDFSQIAGDESMYMNYIGAVYFPGNEDNLKSMARYNVLGNKTSFDGMILIRKTTATHLLRNEKPENSGE